MTDEEPFDITEFEIQERWRLENLVLALGEQLTMPTAPPPESLGPNGTRVDRELRRMMGLLPDPPPQPRQVITQADIEAAEAEYRTRKAAEATGSASQSPQRAEQDQPTTDEKVGSG